MQLFRQFVHHLNIDPSSAEISALIQECLLGSDDIGGFIPSIEIFKTYMVGLMSKF